MKGLSFVKMPISLLPRRLLDSLFAILGGKYILLALPLRINHGFLKPRFQAPGTLAEWFLTHLYMPVSYKTADISGMEKGGE